MLTELFKLGKSQLTLEEGIYELQSRPLAGNLDHVIVLLVSNLLYPYQLPPLLVVHGPESLNSLGCQLALVYHGLGGSTLQTSQLKQFCDLDIVTRRHRLDEALRHGDNRVCELRPIVSQGNLEHTRQQVDADGSNLMHRGLESRRRRLDPKEMSVHEDDGLANRGRAESRQEVPFGSIGLETEPDF